MNHRTITAPGYRVSKTSGPLLNTFFMFGVGVWWYAYESRGNIPMFDIPIGLLLLLNFVQIWRVAVVLKQVEIDGDQLRIKGLVKTISVPLTEMLEVRDYSHYKRTKGFPPPLCSDRRLRLEQGYDSSP